ncbi:MAG: hypothetical protein CMG46_12800 [Candidatus Marinimicrobia bacterium]|nr:hypothetical protein [Candidatus Neomarinimicrobiota bacterium]
MRTVKILLLAASFLGGCAGEKNVVYLLNEANDRVKCGPFSAKAPIGLFLEERFGASNAESRMGPSAETRLLKCIENYQLQGYKSEGTLKTQVLNTESTQPNYQAVSIAERDVKTEAFRNTRRLAEQGDVNAQTLLGKAYKDGRNVPQDYVLAHMWFNLAAAGPVTSVSEKELRAIALQARQDVAGLMSRDQIAEAQKMARDWKPLSQ